MLHRSRQWYSRRGLPSPARYRRPRTECRSVEIDIRHIRIDENADGRCIGSQLTQEPEPLRLQLGDKYADAGEIAAGPMQVGNQPAADRIRCDSKDHG